MNIRLFIETKMTQLFFINKLIRLVLTLFVKMENEFLTNFMFVYGEREIVGVINPELIIDKFDLLKNCRTQLN